MKMKKYISAALASVMAVSSFSVFSASAESYGKGDIDIMVIGDSIAAGSGLAKNEYNYGKLVADYLGGDVWNYAVSGYSSEEILNQLRSFNSTQKEQLADSEYVVVSVGGNDLISYTAEALLDYAAQNDLLAEGKTVDDIPEKKTLETLSEFFDMDAVKEYTKDMKKAVEFNDKLDSIYCNLTYTDAQTNGSAYKQIIAKQVIPNIKAITEEIKAVNPDAKVVIQTIYNPLQFSTEYEENLKNTYSATYYTAYIKFKTIFNNTTKRFAEQLRAVEGIEIAEVLDNISAADSNGKKYGWYFTNMQGDSKTVGIHPTQAGHTAIAVAVLDVIGETREDGGLLALTMNFIKDAENYPTYTMNKYSKYAGKYVLGDLNGDYFIDASDASLILQQYALSSTGKEYTLGENALKAGIITNDEALDSSDASSVLAYYAFTSTGGNNSLKNFIAK